MLDKYINHPMVEWPPEEKPPCKHNRVGIYPLEKYKKCLICGEETDMTEEEVEKFDKPPLNMERVRPDLCAHLLTTMIPSIRKKQCQECGRLVDMTAGEIARYK